jgi:hypothetical protein
MCESRLLLSFIIILSKKKQWRTLVPHERGMVDGMSNNKTYLCRHFSVQLIKCKNTFNDKKEKYRSY